jgi:hypothetical protein
MADDSELRDRLTLKRFAWLEDELRALFDDAELTLRTAEVGSIEWEEAFLIACHLRNLFSELSELDRH